VAALGFERATYKSGYLKPKGGHGGPPIQYVLSGLVILTARNPYAFSSHRTDVVRRLETSR